MIKISELLEDQLRMDDVARDALKRNILNMSAYAKRVRSSIEAKLYKPVSVGSMIVALTRIRPKLAGEPGYLPDVHIRSMSVRANLAEVSFEKTSDTLTRAAAMQADLVGSDSFLAVTQGANELTIIFDASHVGRVLAHFMKKPKGQYTNLTAVTVQFIETEYIEIPNMVYVLVTAIAARRINVIELVSTYTELSFIVRAKDTQATMDALSNFLRTG